MARSLALPVAYMALAACLGWWAGQDVNWDLRNYHFYNAHVWLTDRFDRDVYVAYVQTFLNPILDLPFYAAVMAGVPPIAIGLGLSAFHGLSLWLVHRLTVLILESHGTQTASIAGVVAALTSALGSAFRTEIGSTLGDTTTTVFVLASLSLLITDAHGHHGGRSRTRLAGLLCGLAVGSKAVTAIYGVGLAAVSLATPGTLRARSARTAHFAAAASVGILLASGYWMWQLYRHFESPLFPFYNHVFQSPFAPIRDFASEYFGRMPERQMVLSLPFRLLTGTAPLREVPWRDGRLAVGIVSAALVGLMLAHRWWRERAATTIGERRPLLLLTLFFAVSYVAWTQLFPNYRFAIPLETLSAVLLAGCVAGLVRRPAASLAITGSICVLLILLTTPQSYGRVPWGDDYFGVSRDQFSSYRGTTIVVANLPAGYLVPYFPRSTVFLRPVSNWGLEPGTLMWERLRRQITIAPDRMFLLEYAAVTDAMARDSLQSFGLTVDSSRCESIVSHFDQLRLCRITRGAKGDGASADR